MLLLTMYAGKYTHTHLGRGDGSVVSEGDGFLRVSPFFIKKTQVLWFINNVKLEVLNFRDRRLQMTTDPTTYLF